MYLSIIRSIKKILTVYFEKLLTPINLEFLLLHPKNIQKRIEIRNINCCYYQPKSHLYKLNRYKDVKTSSKIK